MLNVTSSGCFEGEFVKVIQSEYPPVISTGILYSFPPTIYHRLRIDKFEYEFINLAIPVISEILFIFFLLLHLLCRYKFYNNKMIVQKHLSLSLGYSDTSAYENESKERQIVLLTLVLFYLYCFRFLSFFIIFCFRH
jgi:hypothetical protein